MKPAALLSLGFALVLAAALVVSPVTAQEMEMDEEGGSGGSSSFTDQMGAHMHMGPHMLMTDSRPMSAVDAKRARELLEKARQALSKYQDYKTAIADGYQPFMPNLPQEVYHFTNRSLTAAEYAGGFDLAQPGSLLYSKKGVFGGYKLVGAMYSASPDASPSQLDEMIPLSAAHWHAHTNICVPEGVTEQDLINGNVHAGKHFAGAIDPRDTGMSHGRNSSARLRAGYLADPRFGFEGTVSDEAGCKSIGGEFHKQIFGWMVHVYPFAGDDFKVAFGMDVP